ncbi:cadherin domain-containing protein [Candidatus Poriferisodalis sp.]|uniref:cadherin domain-containing protein n=1 Tax=Candidatus Poriferisodalis sp. TaxID=3101277 RepID=UPI003B51BF6D
MSRQHSSLTGGARGVRHVGADATGARPARRRTVSLRRGIRRQVIAALVVLVAAAAAVTTLPNYIAAAQTLAAPAIDHVVAGEAALSVVWSAPDGVDTADIVEYDVRYIETSATDKSDAMWTVVDAAWTAAEAGSDSGGLHAIVSGLANDASYDIGVRAETTVEGSWSATATGTPAEAAATLEDATPIVMDVPVPAAIDSTDDEDYFTFTPPLNSKYVVLTEGGLDTAGTLYAIGSGRPLEASGDARLPPNGRAMLLIADAALVQSEQESGEIAVAVRGQRAATGAYTLLVRSIADPSSSADALSLQLGTPVLGMLHNWDNEDWYRLVLTEQTDVFIRGGGVLDSAAGTDDYDIDLLHGFDTKVQILDSDGNQVAANDDGDLFPRYGFAVKETLDAGTYSVVVEPVVSGIITGILSVLGVTGFGRGWYTIQADVAPTPGTTDATAGTLHVGSGSGGTLDSATDVHYYTFTLDDPASMQLRVIGKPFFDVELQHSDGTAVDVPHYMLERPTHLVGRDATIRGHLDAGTYLVRIEAETTDSGHFVQGDYLMHLTHGFEYEYFMPYCGDPPAGIEDPAFGCQWHLSNTGQFGATAGEDINLGSVWDTNKGDGINIAVVDDGFDYLHDDLSDNVVLSSNHSYSAPDGDILAVDAQHGTAVAGLIAASDNSRGVRGVAPRASIYGYDLLADQLGSDTAMAEHLRSADAMRRNHETTSVSNNSWGSVSGPGLRRASSVWRQAVIHGLINGDGGRGVVYVWSAGNSRDEGGWGPLDEYKTHYGSVAVCSVDPEGTSSIYSVHGPNLWVCAPSDSGDGDVGITTTARYNGYIDGFGGTSAAAPIVSGVVALIRAANRALTWRDVKLILAASARQNDPADAGWQAGAPRYDGDTGLYSFNEQYGFGVVDASAAVEIAQVWPNVPAMVTAEWGYSGGTKNLGQSSAANPADTSVEISTEMDFVEYVEVDVDANARRFRDLRMQLISPAGTVSDLSVPNNTDCNLFSCSLSGRFNFGTAKHLGEDPNGRWTLRFIDELRGRGTKQLKSWRLRLYGHRHGPTATQMDSVTPGATSLTVAWTAPDDSGARPLSGYDVRHVRSDAADKSDSQWTVISGAGTDSDSSYTISGLMHGVRYDVQVRAVNSRNGGPWSVIARGVPGTTDSEPFFVDGAAARREIAEFSADGASVGAPIAARDAEGDTMTYALSGTDASSFEIDGDGQILLRTALDYETRRSYDVTVSVHDGKDGNGAADTTADVSIDVDVGVLDVNEAPTITGDMSLTRTEFQFGEFGSWQASDPERDDVEQWSLEGPDGTQFSWEQDANDANRGQIRFRALRDFEEPQDVGHNNVYDVTIVASDGEARGTFDVQVTVTDIDEDLVVDGPTDPMPAEETTEPIGTYTVTDPLGSLYSNVPITFELSGPDASRVELASRNSSTRTLSFVEVPDHEQPADADGDNVYEVVLTVARSRASGPRETVVNLSITVVAVNEPPQISGPAAVDVVENRGGTVASFAANDPESGESVTWSLSGRDRSLFSIDAAGRLSFDSPPDHEAGRGDTYRVTVNAADETLSDSQAVTVTVTDENEPPRITGPPTVNVVENRGGTVASFAANDPESGESVTWSLSSPDGSFFSIDTAGRLSFDSPPDHEARRGNTYYVTVHAADSMQLTDSRSVTVTVTNIDEMPVITSGPASVTVTEGPVGSLAAYEAFDPDVADTVSWTLTGNDHGALRIGRDTGVLEFVNEPDFEQPADADRNSIYQVTVNATGGSKLATLAVTVTVNNADEPGRLIPSSEQPQDFTMLAMMLSDPDGVVGGAAWLWELSADSATWMPISGNTTSSYTPQFADIGQYLRVTATYRDRHGSGKSVSIVLANPVRLAPDVNHAPGFPATETGTRTVAEDAAVGASLGAPVAAIDVDADVLGYTLSGSDASAFEIDATNGQIRIRAGLDYETKQTHRVSVTAADPSGKRATQPVVITVEDVNEPPLLGGPVAVNYGEHRSDPVASFSARDPEGETILWSLEGPDSTAFDIDESGVVRFGGPPDYEPPDYESPADVGGDGVYEIVVVADDGVRAARHSVHVTVTDTNEQPVISGPAAALFVEGDTGVVADYSASDPEGVPVTWSLGGRDREAFEIDADGSVRFKTPPDFEQPGDIGRANDYELEIRAFDGQTTGTADLVVTVSDVDEPGVVELTPAVPRAGSTVSAALAEPDGGLRDQVWVWERSSAGAGWERIDGASGSSYVPSTQDIGFRLRVTLSYADVHGGVKTLTAESSGAVQVRRASSAGPGGRTVGGGGSGGGGSGGGELDVGVATLVVANGWSPADVGVASVLAARTDGAAVVYTAGEELSEETRALLREASPAEAIIVGGTAAVSRDVRTQIRSASPDSGTSRVFGADRADTAAGVARRILGNPSGAGRVTLIVASGWSPPDIGAAAALAARSGRAAVLYTHPGKLPEASAALLRDYEVARVVLVGGTAVIDNSVQDAIADAASAASISRLTGADRVGTAAQAARRVLGNPAAAPDGITLVIANGWSPPDVGVAAALAAASENAAVAYTSQGMLPEATAALIRDYRPSQVIIVGGRAAVADDVRAAATETALSSADVRRIAGQTRTDTAARAARRILASS